MTSEEDDHYLKMIKIGKFRLNLVTFKITLKNLSFIGNHFCKNSFISNRRD